MKKLLYFQIAVLTTISVLAWIFFGKNIWISVLLGGGCYLIPTAIMIITLHLFSRNLSRMPMGFLLGQSAKTILAILFMVTVFSLYPSLNFLAFLVGLLAVSKIVFFVFWKLNHYGNK